MDKLRSIIFSLGGIVLLSSCSQIDAQLDEQDCYPKNEKNWVICDTKRGYTYKYPSWMRNEQQNQNMISIATYDEESCPSLGLYYSEKNMNIGKHLAKWGKVDYFDIFYTGDFPYMEEPFCRPPSPEPGVSRKHVECEETDYESYECRVKNRDYEIAHGMYSAYAFCAEKDGKAVAICIQQMTDDEALAKSIFESFRWTE